MQAIFRTTLMLALLATALCGCVYRMNIQQGNYLETKTIDQVQQGMTRSQVRYLLGTPMVPDAFDNSRWDYVYYLRKGRLKAPQQRHLIVRFVDEKVSAIDRTSMPSNSTLPLPDAEPPPPSRVDIPPSDPRATQPQNPAGTQPGSPQPQQAPLPKEPQKPDSSPAPQSPAEPVTPPETAPPTAAESQPDPRR